ncbi:MAG: toprim domain-containing protein [Caldilineaceae bacterium]
MVKMEEKMDSNHELELFKRDINLVNFILGQGFALDSSKSDRRTTVLRSGPNKVCCWKSATSDWMFHDLRSGRSGTILDWTRYEQGLSLGHARRALRAFLSRSPPKPLPSHHASVKTPENAITGRSKAIHVWEDASWTPNPSYLSQRGLSQSTLGDQRFTDTFRTRFHAVLFPNFDVEGLCGYEIRKEDGSKRFGRNTYRGLWHSNNIRDSETVVVCESAIDCLSHFELYRWDCAYIGLGGSLSRNSKVYLIHLLDPSKHIIVATDNDRAGEDYFRQFREWFVNADRLTPIGKDWSYDLVYCNKENA